MSDEPRNDGGPAFPFTPNEQMKLPDGTWDQNTEFGDSGMSLRDWFAGMALAGMMAEPRTDDWKNHGKIVAQTAYDYADDMLTQRDKPKP